MKKLESSHNSIEQDSQDPKPKQRRIRRGSTLINLAQVRARSEHQQKQPEKEEAFNDSTIETLLNCNSEMVFVIERKSLEVLAVNQAVEKFLEANYVDINSLYDFFSQETLTAIASKTQSIPYQVITTPSGKDFFVNIETTPIHWSGEDALLLKLTDFDSKFVKKREEEYLRTHEKLKEKLKAADLLIGSTAHDINNIMATVIGNLELILNEIPYIDNPNKYNDFVHDCIDDAMTSAERASALTKQLLKFQKVKEMDLKKTDLNQYVKKLISPLMHWQNKYGIEIRIIDNENGCICNFDPIQISQVVMNLMANAKNAIPNGGTITIAVNNVTPESTPNDSIQKLIGDDKYVCIFIEDDGTGIPEENIGHIFKPGFTTNSLTEDGFGLGLAIVNRAVENHGGKIHVESKTGNGSYTKFYIFLPKDI